MAFSLCRLPKRDTHNNLHRRLQPVLLQVEGDAVQVAIAAAEVCYISVATSWQTALGLGRRREKQHWNTSLPVLATSTTPKPDSPWLRLLASSGQQETIRDETHELHLILTLGTFRFQSI